MPQLADYDASYTPLDAHYADDHGRKYIRKLRDLVFPNIGWSFVFLAVAACANLAVALSMVAHFTGAASLPVVLPALALGGSAALMCDAVLAFLIVWLIANELWYLRVPHAISAGFLYLINSAWVAIGVPFISIALLIFVIVEVIIDGSTVWYVLIGPSGIFAITAVTYSIASIVIRSMIRAEAARSVLPETRF